MSEFRFGKKAVRDTKAIYRFLSATASDLLPKLEMQAQAFGLTITVSHNERPWCLRFVWQQADNKAMNAKKRQWITQTMETVVKDYDNFFIFYPDQDSKQSRSLVVEFRVDNVGKFFIANKDNDPDPYFPSVID